MNTKTKTPVCPICRRKHLSWDARGVGIFSSGAVHYRADYFGSPTRDTREEAVADMCAWRAAKLATPRPLPPMPTRTVTPPQTTPAEPRQPFPAVGIERLARERAWQKFLAEATVSLTVWQLDEQLHAELPSPVDWLRSCTAVLDALINQKAVTP